MNKILKSAVLSGSILAMALTPGLILSTQDNQQTEYIEVKEEATQNESKKLVESDDRFEPVLIDFNLEGGNESEIRTITSTLNTTRTVDSIYSQFYESASEYDVEDGILGIIDNFDHMVTWNTFSNFQFTMKYQLSKTKGFRIISLTTTYDKTEHKIDNSGAWVETPTTGKTYSGWQRTVVPNEIIEAGGNKLNQFTNSDIITGSEYDDYQWNPYLKDGKEGMYFELSPIYSDEQRFTVPIIMHITWPDSYNSEMEWRGKYDVWYESKNSSSLSADINFRSKHKNLYDDTMVNDENFSKSDDQRISKSLTNLNLNSYFKNDNGTYVAIELLEDYVGEWDYIAGINLITNAIKVSNYDLLSRDFATYFNSDININDNDYYSSYDTDGRIRLYTEIPNAETFTTIEDYYNFIYESSIKMLTDTYHIEASDGSWEGDKYQLKINDDKIIGLMIPNTAGMHSQHLTLTKAEDGKQYLGYKVYFDFDTILDSGEDPINDYQDLVSSTISAEEFDQLLNNMYLNLGTNTSISLDSTEWIEGDSVSYDYFPQNISVNLMENNKNRESFKTTNEILVIVITIVSILLLILMIVLLLRKGSKEDNSLEVLKGGGE